MTRDAGFSAHFVGQVGPVRQVGQSRITWHGTRSREGAVRYEAGLSTDEAPDGHEALRRA